MAAINQAVMPMPSDETDRIIYYIEAVDSSMNVARSIENDPQVAGAAECALES